MWQSGYFLFSFSQKGTRCLSCKQQLEQRSPPFGVVTALLITDSIQKADIQQQMNIVAAGGDNTINWVKSRPCIQLQSGGTV